MSNMTKMLGKIIRELREKQKVSREEICNNAGIAHRTLVRIETEESYKTSCENIISICNALDVSVDKLLRKAGIIKSKYPPVKEVIKEDPNLDSESKKILLELYDKLITKTKS